MLFRGTFARIYSQPGKSILRISDLSKKLTIHLLAQLLVLTCRFNYYQTETFNLEKSWSKIAAEICMQISIKRFLFLKFRRNDKNSKYQEDSNVLLTLMPAIMFV